MQTELPSIISMSEKITSLVTVIQATKVINTTVIQ